MALNKKVAAAVGTSVAVSALSFMMSDYIMRMAMDRKMPKTNFTRRGEDPYAVFDEYAERLKNTPHETVEIESHDGLKLVGHWFENEDPKRIILAAHGWRSHWYRDFAYSFQFLREQGCSILYIEQRAQGASEGKYMGFGLTERYDILDWLAWIREKCGTDLPVYLAGISMGATTVLMASGLGLPPEVKGIIADSGFTSPAEIWKHVAKKNMHLPFLLTDLYSRILCRLKLGVASNSYSTVDALKTNASIPVLFVHGQDDSFVPVEMTKENYAACAAPKDILIVPGAIHGMGYYVEKEKYEEKEKEFFRKYDK